MVSKLLFWLFLSLAPLRCMAQFFDSAHEHRKIYRSRGYMIWVPPGEWIFQPADSSMSVFESLTSQSFSVGDAGRTLGPNSLETLPQRLGTLASVEIYDEGNKKFITDSISYFYCNLYTYREVETDITRSYKLNKCRIELIYNSKLLFLNCFYFLNELIEIEPYDPKVKRELIEYMQRNDYALPSWFK